MGASRRPASGGIFAILLAGIAALLAGACVPVRATVTEASLPLRKEVVSAALAQEGLLDCVTYDPADAAPILPPHRQLFTVVQDVESATAGWPDDTAAVAYTNPQQLPELSDGDRVIPSPGGQHALVASGIVLSGGDSALAIAVLYHADGTSTPLMQNCQYATEHAVWSADGRYLAYPVHASYPEIRIHDAYSGATFILIRWDSFTKLHGLSWSPDNRFLAFAQGSLGEERIWVASTDGGGLQALQTGLLPNWSSDGSRITYAQRVGYDSLTWRELTMDPVQPASH